LRNRPRKTAETKALALENSRFWGAVSESSAIPSPLVSKVLDRPEHYVADRGFNARFILELQKLD
jgi:hypothetical protein